MDTLGKRIRYARTLKGLTQGQVAATFGIDRVNVTQWEGDTTKPEIDKLPELAALLETTVEWLLEAKGPPPGPAIPEGRSPAAKPIQPDSPTIQIPDLEIFGSLGPGASLDVYVAEDGDILDPEQIRGYWSLPEYMLVSLGKLKNIYAWEVRGDSMEPTLPGGSVVFVDTSQRDPRSGDIFAINYGDGLMVKRLKLVPRTDKVSVISDNERYGADELLREDVHIWGRIVGSFQWRG